MLSRVATEDAYANLLLPTAIARAGLDTRDAGFATELVSGTLRRQGTYDAVLAACVTRPLPSLDPGVLIALRLGAHQLLSMRVPTHAAVSTSVDLVRRHVGHGPAGLVNAVLRKVGGHDLPSWVRRLAPDDDLGFRVVAHSHPAWIVEALTAAVGPDQIDALLEADNLPPRVTLVARPGLATPEELTGAVPTGVSPFAAVLGGGDPGSVPAVVEGRAGVQDEGSQLVALAVAEAAVDGRDRYWLDACAGPGGKAALLAALAAQRGARVLAGERQPHRASLVAFGARAAHAGLLGVVAADATRPPWADDTFDRVLVDAPCSGLGALRRRPESRWRRTSAEVTGLVPLQRSLLEHALDAVRPGGVVGYATCSPVLAETRDVVAALVAERDDVRLEDARPLFPPGLPGGIDGPLEGTVQLWPHRHGTDAMFFALLRRLP